MAVGPQGMGTGTEVGVECIWELRDGAVVEDPGECAWWSRTGEVSGWKRGGVGAREFWKEVVKGAW